jgi:hypothetical protein
VDLSSSKLGCHFKLAAIFKVKFDISQIHNKNILNFKDSKSVLFSLPLAFVVNDNKYALFVDIYFYEFFLPL